MDLTFITVVTGDLCFCWETEVLCNNLRKYGYSSNLQVLVDKNSMKGFEAYWEKLKVTFKEVSFFFYNTDQVTNLRALYPPVIRPNILKQHFKLFPQLSENAIFYIDSDIVFTKYLDFKPFLSDKCCYLSDTHSYISADYFQSKGLDVLPEKKKKYETVDVLNQACKIVGITKEIAIANNHNSGGAQYLLKNIDWKFWEKVENDCVIIYLYLKNDINQNYFLNQSKGFQAWCADMWAVLWNLWLRGQETKCPSELDFSWATNKIDRWYNTYIFHNAGVTMDYITVDGEIKKVFNKVDPEFRNNKLTPFDIELTGYNEDMASSMYVKEILDVQNPICKQFST